MGDKSQGWLETEARLRKAEDQLASLTEENERLAIELRVSESRKEEWGQAVTRRGDTIRGLQDRLASERARADELEKNVADTLDDYNEATKALSEAEQRAEALDTKLRAIRTAFLDGRLMDLGEILDNPNPESKTDA